MTELPPATVATPVEAATVVTTVVKRRPWKIVLINTVNAIVSALFAILGYLQTINLSGIVTPEKALIWMVVINVLTIILRQFFSPPETVQTVVSTTK